MAIFGTLDEMPLPEVLTMLGRRTGKLHISGLPQKQVYELHLDKTNLKALYVNGKLLATDLFVHEAMIKLANCEQGTFRFQRLLPDKLEQSVSIPINKLLLQIVTTSDEMQVNRDHFPNSETKFKSSGHVDIWLDDTLYDFWQSSISLLNEGASAESISQSLSLDIELVKHNLYKLRSLGKIVPLRAFEQSNPTSRKLKEGTGLNKNIENMTYREIISWLQTTQPETLTQSKLTSNNTTTDVVIPKKSSLPRKGLVSRLLKALSGHK